MNYYSRAVVDLETQTQMPRGVDLQNVDRTDAGWEIYPDGLRLILERLADDYKVPSIYITENGAAYADMPDADGHVRDQRRIDYLREHVSSVANAIRAGAPVDGYFVWSLLDNFEWDKAYNDKTRFGIVYVDYDTQERYIKDSARWYSSLIAAHEGMKT